MASKYRCTCGARVKFGNRRASPRCNLKQHRRTHIRIWDPHPNPPASTAWLPTFPCAGAVYGNIPRPHKFQTRQHAGQRALLPARLCSVAPKGQGESEKTRGEQFEPRTQSEGEGKHASKQGSVEARKHASKHASKIREGEVKHASKQAIK